jgi:MFS transporter, SHS family, lactate transporter
MRANWFLFVYMVVLMSGYNSVSHGSQDLYPTFLKNQVNMGPTQVTVITVVGQIGALVGSTVFGYVSTFTGRRPAMMLGAVLGGALVPSYIFLRNDKLIATCFFEQFFVGGSWGPVPVRLRSKVCLRDQVELTIHQVHLVELSPPVLRTFIYGLSYQLGNLASSASSTIEATIGQRFPLPPGKGGEKRYDYGKVIGIFLGAVWAYILLFVFLGPEMTQEERDEEAVLAHELENMRAQGVSMQEIGRIRSRGGDVKEVLEEVHDEKGSVGRIEEA